VIVVDASAVVLGLLNDAGARRLMAEEPLAAPHLIDSEVAHALRGQVVRRVITEPVGTQALHRWTQLGVSRFAAVGLLARVWELRDNVSAYDATYIALAEQLDCHLVTADARLSRAHGPRCPITVVRI
jgi:predicted nucleic acid-binding protein